MHCAFFWYFLCIDFDHYKYAITSCDSIISIPVVTPLSESCYLIYLDLERRVHGVTWHCMALHGIAWHCMALHGGESWEVQAFGRNSEFCQWANPCSLPVNAPVNAIPNAMSIGVRRFEYLAPIFALFALSPPSDPLVAARAWKARLLAAGRVRRSEGKSPSLRTEARWLRMFHGPLVRNWHWRNFSDGH